LSFLVPDPSLSAGSTRRCSIGRAATWRRPCAGSMSTSTRPSATCSSTRCSPETCWRSSRLAPTPPWPVGSRSSAWRRGSPQTGPPAYHALTLLRPYAICKARDDLNDLCAEYL